MNKLRLLLLTLLLPILAHSQATTGAHRVNQVIAKSQTGVVAQVVPYATVVVTNTATGGAATIYSDPLLTVPIIPSVVHADNLGNYSYYLPLAYCVTESVSSPGQGSSVTPNAFCSGSGTGCVGGGSLSAGCTGATNQPGAFTNIVGPGGTMTGALFTPAIGNIILVDGYTSGTDSGAWTTGFYDKCSVVSYGGLTYISTEPTTNVVPGTGDSANAGAHAYDWMLVRSDGLTYAPSPAECADATKIGDGERATIGAGNNVGKSYSLNFGSGTYGIVNALFGSDPAPMFNGSPRNNRVALSFIGQGSHSTHIVQAGTLPTYTTSDGTMNTLPTSLPTATLFQPVQTGAANGASAGGYAPKTWAIQGIDVSGAGIAPFAIDNLSFNVNASFLDVQYESGTVGQARFGFSNPSNDSWTSSMNGNGLTEYSQGQGAGGAYLTASIFGGVPTIGFGVQFKNVTKGSGYPTTGSGTCTVNGGTSTAVATCTVTADGLGGTNIALTAPGTYSTSPTSVTITFGSGTGAGATPFISAGSSYGPNTQIVLLGTKNKTSIYPCTTMPPVSTYTPANSSVPVYLYPQGSITPTISGGAITLGPWATATGASGCVGPMEVWASDLGSTPVAVGTNFANVTDSGNIGGLFGTSGAVCTFNFSHGNNKISGIHYQGQGRYGICNGSSNIYDLVNDGEQYEGGIYSYVPYQYDHVEVSYSIPFPYHALATQTVFAAATSAGSGGTIKNVICGSNPFVRATSEYNDIVNYKNGGVTLSSYVNGSGYTVLPTCSVSGGTPLLNAQGLCSVSADGNGGIIPHIDSAGAYAPGSATPTIVYTGGNGTGASAVVSLLGATTSVWNSPTNTFTTDVDNLDYCGPLTAGSRFGSKSASIALNGVSDTINQTNSASAQGFSGPLGLSQVLTDDVIDAVNGYGGNAITYTVTGNTATNSLVQRGNQWTWTNNLTGGGHVQHMWGVITGMGTGAGAVTDDATDFTVTDNGMPNSGTTTARVGYKCQSPLNGTSAFCVDDQSGAGIRTSGSLQAGASFQFSVDKTTGVVTAPNIPATARPLALKVGQYGAISGSGTGEAYPPLPQAITLLSATAFNLTAPAGCATYPVITLWDVTQSHAMASVTLAAGTFQYTMTINNATAAAGDVLAFRTNTAPVTCGTNAAQVTINAWYN